MCSSAAPAPHIQATSGPLHFVPCHLREEQQPNRGCTVVDHAGRFLEQSLDVFASTMNVNYFGTLHVLKAALPAMVERRQGEVVLVSSAAAVCGAHRIAMGPCARSAINNLLGSLSLVVCGRGGKHLCCARRGGL